MSNFDLNGDPPTPAGADGDSEVLRLTFAELQSRHEVLEREIERITIERDGYKNAYAQIESEFGALRTEAAGYKTAYDEIQASMGSIVTERDGYKNAYTQIEKDFGGLRSEAAGYKKAYDEIQATMGEVLVERDDSRKALAEIESDIVALRSEATGYKDAYVEIVEELGRLRSPNAAVGLEGAAPDDKQTYPDFRARTQQPTISPPTARSNETMNTDSKDHKTHSDLDRSLQAARALLDAGNRKGAVNAYKEIFRRSYGNGEIVRTFMLLSKDYFAESIAARDQGKTDEAISLAVTALELNPDSGEIRVHLDSLLQNFAARDMTKECLIFPDHARATAFYGNAIQTALDFAIYGGIVGDILEFGVLAGWTSRLFAERMRAGRFYGDLYLFDSFCGLPRNKEEIDRESHDVNRGIWDTEMELPQSLIDDIGAPIEVHISKMLSTVISPDRIHIRKGFFSDSLKQPIRKKAAIVHLDCDLYQSTREVLDALVAYDVLQDGTVMMFDDWNCNRANPAFGQRRAMREFLEANADRYSASHYFNYGYNCAAFIIHDLKIVPTIDAQPILS